MEQSFYKDKLSAKGIAVCTPGETDRMFINNSIFNEMAKGIFSPETKQQYLSIIKNMTEQGAGGIIFGYTEIPILIKPGETTIPAFDTTLIHANAAVRFAINE